MRRYRERNPDKGAEYMRERRKDPQVVVKQREYDKKRYWSDAEYHRERSRIFHAKNPLKTKVNRAKYWECNPGARNAARMKRYASKKQATPIWAKIGYMNLWYSFAKLESERTGREVEVDHMVPIQSPNVCGLHCEDNMQLLFKEDNRKKQNTSWPHMWQSNLGDE